MSKHDEHWRSQLLEHVVDLLNSSLDINQLIDHVARLSLPYLADWCTVSTIRNNEFHHVAFAHRNPSQEALVQAFKKNWIIDFNAKEGIARALRTGESLIYSDITPDQLSPRQDRPVSTGDFEHLGLMRELGMRSHMVVPLIARGKTIGVMAFVSSNDPHHFNQEKLKAAEQLAHLCALLIDNSELFRDLQNSALRSKTLADASSAFAAAELNLPTILKAVVSQIAQSIGNGCTLRLLSPERDRLDPVAFFHSNPNAVALLEKILSTGSHHIGEGLAGQVAQTGKSALAAEVTPEMARSLLKKEHWSFLEQFHIHSMIVVPLRVREEVIGTISLFRDESTDSYTKDDLVFLEELANRAAQAMQNAKLYAESQKAVQIREEFLSVASHELNTPLTSLLLATRNLEVLMSKTSESNEQIKKMTKILVSQSQHLSQLITNLLDVSRVRSGHLELNLEKIDLPQLIYEVADRFRLTLENARSSIEINVNTPVIGSWDRLRIEQVVNNLMSNAIKYGAGKPIEVSVELIRDNVQLSIKDHGIGIDPSQQKIIFEPFERAVSSKSYGGLGLGLYIVRQIIEAHGGSISIESSLNQGSTFMVSLPLEQKKGDPHGIQTH